MFGKSRLLAMMLIPFSYAYAAEGTGSIGTVSARGDIRVDGYNVSSNGTLFDGTTVETGPATAMLRLNNGTEIMLSSNSHGVVYSNHLVLLQGKSELKNSSSSFLLEAKGLRVASSGPDAFGVVALGSANTVDVAAVTGELRIVNNAGLPLARVATGAAFSFPAAQEQQPAAPPAGQGQPFKEIEGVMNSENGGYYVTDLDGTKYELVTGNNIKKFAGKNVAVTGFVQASTAGSGVTQLIVTAIQLNGTTKSQQSGTGSKGSKEVLIGVAVAGGAAAVIGIAVSESSKSPASP